MWTYGRNQHNRCKAIILQLKNKLKKKKEEAMQEQGMIGSEVGHFLVSLAGPSFYGKFN